MAEKKKTVTAPPEGSTRAAADTDMDVDDAPGAEAPARYTAPALEKGLDILEALADSVHGYTLNELARKISRSVGEIFRMAVTLERRGFVRVDENDRYSLTLRMFELSHRQQPLKSLVLTALPLMRELANRARQSCHLTVYQEGRVVVIAQVDGPDRWFFGLKVGVSIGLGDTSAGHVLLAFRDEVDRARMLAAHARVEGELDLDPGELFAMLDEVRNRGYGLMPSRQIKGVVNIAFPVMGVSNQLIAAINVPHIERIDQMVTPSVEQVCEIVSNIAGRLSALMGYSSFDELNAPSA